ncbi:hypothetical protein Y032_0014g2300 [Ancylostoma ceylanicum]|uniref:Uncharacterized protein n=1 Tax=Ancylostoma ceylanicum TaxID=53326 RepID=A0A016VBJ5_9BILA|nr:hypothetical protein Y032_0014g2300 [Ancylostoma ceylanicum]
MEMKMLRWMAGVTRYDHICNEDIRHRFGIATMADKLRRERLRCATVCKTPSISMYPASGQKDDRSSDGHTPLRLEISWHPLGPSARSGQMASTNQQSGSRHHTGETLKKKKKRAYSIKYAILYGITNK